MLRNGRIIEGFWDCTQCSEKGIRGGLRNCTCCGSPRGTDTVFYMKDPSSHYVSQSVANEVSQCPDWLCSYCEYLNSSKSKCCSSCGALKSDSEKNYFEMRAEKKNKIEASDNTRGSLQKQNTSSNKKSTLSLLISLIRSKPFEVVKFLLAVLSLFLVVFGLISVLVPKKDTLTIQGFSWERVINIEELKTIRKSGWTLPDEARLVDSKSELHHYNQVVDHYETVREKRTRQVIDHYESYVSGYRDLGNGHFQEVISKQPVYKTETYYENVQKPVYKQVPVYKTKYYYDNDEWVSSRKIETSGKDKNLKWGTYNLSSNEREGKRVERLYISATNKKGKLVSYKINSKKWQSLNIGDVVDVEIDIFDSVSFK